jgi:hypothetical protein
MGNIIMSVFEFLSGRGKYAEEGDDLKDLAKDLDTRTKRPFNLFDIVRRALGFYDRVDVNHRYRKGQTHGYKDGGSTYRNTGKHGHIRDDQTHYR